MCPGGGFTSLHMYCSRCFFLPCHPGHQLIKTICVCYSEPHLFLYAHHQPVPKPFRVVPLSFFCRCRSNTSDAILKRYNNNHHVLRMRFFPVVTVVSDKISICMYAAKVPVLLICLLLGTPQPKSVAHRGNGARLI